MTKLEKTKIINHAKHLVLLWVDLINKHKQQFDEVYLKQFQCDSLRSLRTVGLIKDYFIDGFLSNDNIRYRLINNLWSEEFK